MDTNSTIIIVSLVFALVIITGFILFRQKAKVNLKLPGTEMNFEGGNNHKGSNETNPKNRSNGIFRTLSIGKTRIKVKGSGTIADAINIGDTALTKEDMPLPKRKKNKK